MTKVSVIIPAFNEERYILKTLKELQRSPFLEIIVVDNGSSDNTAEMAKSLGVTVINLPVGTIAAVRNRGVKEASGDILIFIDSDVRVTSEWHRKLPSVIETIMENPLAITGSRCQSPKNNSLLNKYWYSQLSGYIASYINSGNLITSRVLFQLVGGFSEELETAEDYDFCKKAKKASASIYDDKDLAVIHDGYPQSIYQFMQRERWHGKQDVKTWSLFFESKIAWIAAFHLFLLLSAIGAVLNGIIFAVPVFIIVMYAISFLLVIYKFGANGISYMLVMPILFYVYICGRSLSIVDRLFKISLWPK